MRIRDVFVGAIPCDEIKFYDIVAKKNTQIWRPGVLGVAVSNGLYMIVKSIVAQRQNLCNQFCAELYV